MKTIENNKVIVIDPDEEAKVVAELLLKMNAYVSIKTAEVVTTLDKVTQYLERKAKRFPKLHSITCHGQRKAYKIQDLKDWLENPQSYLSLEDYYFTIETKRLRIKVKRMILIIHNQVIKTIKMKLFVVFNLHNNGD